MDIGKKLLNINEAATALGLGRSLVYTLITSGELKSIKIGRARRIPLSALDDFIASRLVQETNEDMDKDGYSFSPKYATR